MKPRKYWQKKGVFVVPTLSTMWVITTEGEQLGLPPSSLEKN